MDHHDAPVGFLKWMIIALAQGCGGRPHFSTTGGSQKDGNLRGETKATKATKAKKTKGEVANRSSSYSSY